MCNISLAAPGAFMMTFLPGTLLMTFTKRPLEALVSFRGCTSLMLTNSTFVCRPVPMERTVKRLICGQHWRASSRATCAGLLYGKPPSTYHAPGAGTLMKTGSKNDGAALVARAAFQMAHLDALFS